MVFPTKNMVIFRKQFFIGTEVYNWLKMPYCHVCWSYPRARVMFGCEIIEDIPTTWALNTIICSEQSSLNLLIRASLNTQPIITQHKHKAHHYISAFKGAEIGRLFQSVGSSVKRSFICDCHSDSSAAADVHSCPDLHKDCQMDFWFLFRVSAHAY